MAGAIVLVVILVLFPVFVAIGGFVLAVVFGWLLNDDAAKRFEGSELAELNR